MKILVAISGAGAAKSVNSVVRKDGKIHYAGLVFPDFDKPIVLKSGKHKRAVLAKKGKFFKLVRYGRVGYEDFTTHKDKERRDRFRARFRGILTKEGKPAYKDKWTAAHWAYYDLW
jgi:hypothetical protein